MTLLEKLREKLGQELMSQVEDAVGDDFDWDVVPRSRLNKVIGQRNALNSKLQSLSSGSTAEDDDDDSGKGSSTKGTEGNEIETLKAQHKKELDDISKRYAVLDKLRADGAKDPSLLLGIMNLDKITLKEDGTLEGYDDQITPKKTSHAYLFNTASDDSHKGDDDSAAGGTGRKSQSDNSYDVDPFEAVIASYTTK